MRVKCPFCPRVSLGDDQPVTYNQKELVEHTSSHANDRHLELEAVRLYFVARDFRGTKPDVAAHQRKQLLARVSGNVAAGSAVQLTRDLRLGVVLDFPDEVDKIASIATEIADDILRKVGL